VSIVEVVLRGLGYGLGYCVVLGVCALALSLLVTWDQEHRSRTRRQARLTANRPSDAARTRARMRRREQPTLLLTPARAPGFSKLGGDPDLPADILWPTGPEGPLSFLAQIELKAVRSQGGPPWLSSDGVLYAFGDLGGYGDPNQVRVLYSLDAPANVQKAPVGARSFSERRVAVVVYASIPSLDWLGIDVAEFDVDPDELDELADAPDRAYGDELQHRVGGYPSELQDERMAITCERIRRRMPPYSEEETTPAIERAARAWRLLLQIDSDPGLGMSWGDSGRLYVFVREQDALKSDFTRTVTISQTY
jgi:uncharacterized protein YwqG